MTAQLQSNGGDDAIIMTVTQTIDDLQPERLLSGDYERFVRARVVVMMADHQSRSASASRSSDYNPSDDVDTDNANV